MTNIDTRHELIYGPIASGKTRLVRQRLDTEKESDTIETWIIDPMGGQSLGDWAAKATYFAADIAAARHLLSKMRDCLRARSAHARSVGTLLLSVTVEEAAEVFRDRQSRVHAEEIACYARMNAARLRVVVTTLDLDSFGGSTLLRSQLLEGNVTECCRADA